MVACLLPPLLFLLLPILISTDELISVRCQTQCLHNLEMKNLHNAEVRRAMKHHVVSVCTADQNCSACTNPCSETFVDRASCSSKFCEKLTGDAALACHESCTFLDKIYSEKPGACPAALEQISTNYECAASCHLDGDCGETWKCCSVGCSRKCLQPDTSSASLLPVPSGISVTERKRRRSAVVKWKLRKLSKKQANTLSNLFVIQWRWGLHETAMGQWQTILIKNKDSAILKHLLSPGRLYQFRVASVSIEGSLGFSSGSVPFKLSKEARAPTAPTVTLGASRLSPSGLWSQTVQWTVPPSDLPIKNYEVSWEESTEEAANAFEGRTAAALKRNADEEEDDSGVDGFTLGGFGGKTLRKTALLASHHTSIFIEGLTPSAVYLVEVHGIVESSEGELHGEKGVLFLATSSLSLDPPPSSSSVARDDGPQHASRLASSSALQVASPSIDKGKLVAAVSWVDTAICVRRGSYVLRLRKNGCGGAVEAGSDWEERLLSSCSTMLDGLAFDCAYSLEVYAQNDAKTKLASSLKTLPCESTLPSTPSLCLPSSPLSCSIQSFVVLCHWPHSQAAHESTIGYRVSLTSADSKTSEISILPPQTPETTFQNLRSGVEYNVEVQPITSRGIGSSLMTRFRAPIDEEEEMDKEESIIDHLSGGEIIELPLESSSLSLTSTYSIVFALLLCRLWY